MIKEEGGGVNESPSEILSAGEAALRQLFFTQGEIVKPTVMARVDTWLLLKRSKKSSEFNELRINGKRFASLGKFLIETFEGSIIFTEILRDCIELCLFALIFLKGKGLLDVCWEGKGKWAVLSGDGKSEFSKSVDFVVRLLEREPKNASAFELDRVRDVEDCGLILPDLW
jgi:hypothetical protein